MCHYRPEALPQYSRRQTLAQSQDSAEARLRIASRLSICAEPRLRKTAASSRLAISSKRLVKELCSYTYLQLHQV